MNNTIVEKQHNRFIEGLNPVNIKCVDNQSNHQFEKNKSHAVFLRCTKCQLIYFKK